MRYAICDIHTHILPGMDDGCKTPEESVAVLRECYAQGVSQIIATPHYYPVEAVDAFLKRREASMKILQEHISQCPDPLPEICLGAEVAYRPGIDHEENLHKLCFGKSNYLLLELPLSNCGEDVVRAVRNICFTRSITPIIAHIERYIKNRPTGALRKILQEDVIVQMNAEHLLKYSTRRYGKNLIRYGQVHLLGSDTHNITTRRPNMAAAVEYLEEKHLDWELQSMQDLCQMIFCEATGKSTI